jgi:hypothetical protein
MLLALFMRYLYTHDMFWLAVNHADDPVSFSVYDEQNIPDLLARILQMDVSVSGGFFVSAKPVRGGATFLDVHGWYLTSPDQFAKLVAETSADGYRRFVEPTLTADNASTEH